MEKETFQIYEWIIENFSFWNSYVHGDSIKSPNFVEHGCIQQIVLLRRNFPCKYMQISFSVAKSEPSGGNLSIIGADGNLIYTGRVSEIIQGDCYCFVPWISFEALAALIRKNKAQYGDQLTFRLCFLSKEGLVDRVSSTLDVLNKSLKIEPKSIASIKLNDYKDIAIIHYNKNNDLDKLLLRAYRRHETTEFILHLFTKSSNSVLVKCQWRIHNDSDKTLLNYKEIVHLYKIGGPWTFLNSLAMSELVDRGASMHLSLEIVNGNFTEKSSQDMSVPKKTTRFFDEKSAKTSVSSTSNKTGDSVSALAKDSMSLHPSDAHLELKCGNISFPVHKDILAARSPFFNYLLSMETAPATVDMTDDLDAATLSRFVTFLYSGAVEGLNVESAMRLCDAADRYQVFPLKTVCSAFLCDNVARSNVCEIISHAYKHQNVELMLLATKKILQNYNEVIGSERWINFARIEPMLAAEVLTNFAARFCVGHGRKSI